MIGHISLKRIRFSFTREYEFCDTQIIQVASTLTGKIDYKLFIFYFLTKRLEGWNSRRRLEAGEEVVILHRL